MISKSELRSSITEVVDETISESLSVKDKQDFIEALVDRLQVDFDILDDEEEDEAEPELTE